MQMAQRDTQAVLGSSPAEHKVPRRWVGCPTLFHGRVGIGAYARMALKGGTYHQVCIWLVLGMCIPRTLWVSKVGLKDGLKWPSSATGPSPLGFMGPRAGQVKIQTNYQSRSSLFCAMVQSPPLPHTCQTRHQPPTTMVKSSLLRLTTKQSPP